MRGVPALWCPIGHIVPARAKVEEFVHTTTFFFNIVLSEVQCVPAFAREMPLQRLWCLHFTVVHLTCDLQQLRLVVNDQVGLLEN